MIKFTRYNPKVCFILLILIIFVVWLYTGNKNRDFVGLSPLNPRAGGHAEDVERWKFSIPEEEPVPRKPIIKKIDSTDTDSFIADPYQTIDLNRPTGRFRSKGEMACKSTLEKIYGLPFNNSRPNWLKNPETGARLELDCYNEDLKIAVEYNGAQHYTWPNYTNQTYDQFINQVRRDILKVELCEYYGVYLLTVPYNIGIDKIPNYIKENLPQGL